MVTTSLPKFDREANETGCCPRFNPAGWDGEEFEFPDRRFVRATTFNVMHIPLNMGSMFRKTFKKIEDANAAIVSIPGRWLSPARTVKRIPPS